MSQSKNKIIVDFCIRGDDFNPHDNLDKLNIDFARSYKKGDKYIGKKRDENHNIVECEKQRPWGIWGIDTKSQDNLITVEDHIKYILEILEPNKRVIKELLNSNKEYSSRLYIYFEFNKDEFDVAGYEISNKLLDRINDLCQYIDFRFSTF